MNVKRHLLRHWGPYMLLSLIVFWLVTAGPFVIYALFW